MRYRGNERAVHHDIDMMLLQVLVGWSNSQMVMAFRGTASLTNAWADIKVS